MEKSIKSFSGKLEEVLKQFYEYIIRGMDESRYADENIVEEYYVPSYLKGLIDDDTEYFTKLIMSKIIRAKNMR